MGNDKQIDKLIRGSLKEDIGKGDITVGTLFAEDFSVTAQLTSKADGVICGLEIFKKVFLQLSPDFMFSLKVEDADRVKEKKVIGEITGPVKALLAGERTALNFLQHLSGVATAANAFVNKSNGNIKIYDTRKTTPGLRHLEKYAVKVGGCENHRMGLFDMVLIKENHINAYRYVKKSNREKIIRRMVEKAKGKLGNRYKIEVEVETLSEAKSAYLAGADIIMFDNMKEEALYGFIKFTENKKRKVEIEWSGNVTLNSIERLKKLPVDIISVGEITHSAKALDFSLKIK
jgi:nicotinate-nucleotide pyrophosphorylase (carboxylating)